MSPLSLPLRLRSSRRIELTGLRPGGAGLGHGGASASREESELRPGGAGRRHESHSSSAVHDPAGQRGYCQYRPVGSWRPAVNLYESADGYFVGVDLAGMSREAIEVTLNGNVLMISGSREHPRPPGCPADLSIHLMEIEQGPFCRSVEIPSEVDLSAIEARYTRTGYLWVELPKRGR